jgi:acyl-CoA thioester hydrolase
VRGSGKKIADFNFTPAGVVRDLDPPIKEKLMTKRYSTSIDLRFSDLDLYGHVNSAIYFTYLETARIKLFKESFQELTNQGIFIVVGRAECDYKYPIVMNDTVVVSAWVSRIGTTSFDFSYRIHNNDERTFATAVTTMVCIDSVKKKPVAVPELVRSME